MGYMSSFKLNVERYQNVEDTEDKGFSVEDIINNAQSTSGIIDLKMISEKVTKALSVEDTKMLVDMDVIERLRDENEDAQYALDEFGDSVEQVKWYDHVQDLKKFSAKHQGWLFTLDIHGEEKGDIRRVYFLNGKAQEENAKIVFDEFNIKKLV